MTFPWQKMTVEEFALVERILKPGITQAGGVWWHRVRPLFYRPLLPFHEHEPHVSKPPPQARLGGFQHAVLPGKRSNSFLNLLMFDDLNAYSLDSLSRSHKRQIRRAMEQFVVRPIANLEEFQAKAYPVYCSFHQRTGYQFASQRTNRKYFDWWAEKLFQNPKLLILGGWLDGELVGISMPPLVEDTVCYTTFFCNTESLRLNFPALMLHSIMDMAAKSKCARQIFVGYHKSENGKGVDEFYFQRGYKLVRKPALLHLNPLAGLLLRHLLPRQYAHLGGDIPGTPGSKDVEPGTTVQKPHLPDHSEQAREIDVRTAVASP